MTPLKLRGVLEEGVSAADEGTGRGFEIHCGVIAFS